MNDRRSFLTGVGGVILGAAAYTKSAEATSGPAPIVLYSNGLVWNASLLGPSSELRLQVYLAVRADGTGAGTLSDPVNSQANSHLRILQAFQERNQYRFHGEIVLSNSPELLAKPFVIYAIVHGDDETRIWLQLRDEVFAGAGAIFIIRAKSNNNFPP